ncbi:hypothetical protein DFQ26_004097, partial [Actinomortierella ambigua]
MTTAAANTNHFLDTPRRNIIWIPMDLYRKYTESSSSSSSSSSSDLSPSNCSWHSNLSSKTKRSLGSRKSRDILHDRHSRTPSAFAQGKISKTRSSKQRLALASSSLPLPTAKELLPSSSMPSPYRTPSPEDQCGATTLATLFTTALSPSSPQYGMLSTPLSTSEVDTFDLGPSNTPTPFSSSSHTRLTSQWFTISKTGKEAEHSIIDPSDSQPHSLSLVPPKKRKRDQDGQTNTPPKSPRPKHRIGSQAPKRLKQTQSSANRATSSTKTNHAARQPQEIIVISDDELHNIVSIESDEEDHYETGVLTTAGAAFPSPSLSISSPSTLSTLSSVTYLSTRQSITTPVSATATSSTRQSSNAGVHHKYELDRHLRHLVETIFPAHEEATSKTVLERALATSRKLRDEFIIDRFLGSGCSGFVLAAKRVQDGKN